MEKSIIINKYLNTTTIQTWSFSAFWQKGTDLSGGRKCWCEWHILCGMTQWSRLRREKIHVAETYKVTGDVFFLFTQKPTIHSTLAGHCWATALHDNSETRCAILTYTLGCFVQVTFVCQTVSHFWNWRWSDTIKNQWSIGSKTYIFKWSILRITLSTSENSKVYVVNWVYTHM